MNDSQRRKYERRDTLNLVDYVVLDDEGHQLGRSMGRTRNVSEGGLLLETRHPLETGQSVLITVALYDDTVELEGTVVHIEPSEEKGFWSGVEFQKVGDEEKRILQGYIEFVRSEEMTE